MIMAHPTRGYGLTQYSVVSLRTMANFHDLETGRKKVAMVRDLVAYFEGRDTAQTLGFLDDVARAVLDLVHLSGAWTSVSVLASATAARGVTDSLASHSGYGYSKKDHGNPWAIGSTDLRDVLARLEVHGLLVGDKPRFGFGQVVDLGAATFYSIPQEIQEALPPVDPGTLSRREAPAEWAAADPRPFGRSLYTLWSFIWRQEPALLKKGTLGKRSLKQLAQEYPLPLDVDEASSEADLPMVHRQHGLLDSLGLIAREGKKHRVDHEASEAHWRASPGRRAGAWYDAWLFAWGWNELDNIPGLEWSYSGVSGASVANHIIEARREIVRFLSTLWQDGQWHSVAQLSSLVEMHHRDALVPAKSWRVTPWSSRYSASHNLAGLSFPDVWREAEGWRKVEHRFIEQLMRTLHVFGLLDLAEGEEGLEAVRLSALGRYALAEGPEPPAVPGGGRIVLQPNFHILAMGPVPEGDLLRLERFATRTATDRAIEFFLDARSVYRAQRAGLGVEQVVAELRSLTEEELPQNVLRSLEEWQESHEQIVVRVDVGLLHAVEPEHMAELTDQDAARGVLRPLAPTFALVENPSRLDALLSAAEILPSRGHDPQAKGTVRLEEDGTVALARGFADLYTIGPLDALAERDPTTGACRLTADSARAAKEERGWDAEQQIALWRGLCVGEDPPWLARRIKSWLGSYGKARLRRAWVLELERPEALEALEEALGPARGKDETESSGAALARPWRAYEPESVPVLVDPDDLATLRALLREHGIEFEES